MPWKVVTRQGKIMSLKKAVDGIFSRHESEAKESEKRERVKEEIEKKPKEYYETRMKEETERLNTLVDWYKLKLNKIREAPVVSRPRKLGRLYQISEANKHLGVTITGAGTLNPVNCPGCPPELKLLNTRIMRRIPFTMLQSQVHCLLDVNHTVSSIISSRSLELIKAEMKMRLNMLKR